jgi:hypothetical protein
MLRSRLLWFDNAPPLHVERPKVKSNPPSATDPSPPGVSTTPITISRTSASRPIAPSFWTPSPANTSKPWWSTGRRKPIGWRRWPEWRNRVGSNFPPAAGPNPAGPSPLHLTPAAPQTASPIPQQQFPSSTAPSALPDPFSFRPVQGRIRNRRELTDLLATMDFRVYHGPHETC